MAKLFNQVPSLRPKLNKFDLSHERKMSLNMGDLVPIIMEEIIPGDKFRVKSEIMLRFAPMLAPIMHRVNVYTHYFFVPNRLIWDEWEDFITGGRLGTSAPTPVYGNLDGTSVSAGLFQNGSLADYMGCPTVEATAPAPIDAIGVSMLPFRAYQLIWDEYYRDQNLAASLDISKASGGVSGAELTKLLTMRKRAWEKDYFTSALPFAQRGAEVMMPIELTGTGAVYADPVGAEVTATVNATANTGAVGYGITIDDEAAHPGDLYVKGSDFSGASTSINDLRRAVKLQEWLERNARGGARYIEQMLSHFNVISSDSRLQRPEYLGGGRNPVVISEVLSTFQNDTGDPQGNMAGHGVSYGNTNGFSKRFEEHGFVIGLMSVLPKTAYQQGFKKTFQRFDKFDYFWPEFAQLGEQEVKQGELYYDPTAPVNTWAGTFGYQSRYAEYKYGCSTVHGDFRDNLAFWHMGRIFDSVPALNEAFVTSDPTTRIFAVEDDTHKLWCQIYNRVDALRPMPYFGTPTL